VHWGLEFAKFGGPSGYKRYRLGITAPIIAWPTIILPYEWAMITQFAGFVFFYWADALYVTRGWAPPWYMTYRFVLTFVVGAAVVFSLVGRQNIEDHVERTRFGLVVPDPGSKARGEARGERELVQYERMKAKVMDDKAERERAERERAEKKRKEEEKRKAEEAKKEE